MAVFAIRESAWQQANQAQRWVLRLAARRTELGQPAVYEQANGTGWFVFSDDRIDLVDVAIMGAVAAGLQQVPTLEEKPSREQVYSFVRNNIVLPKDVAYTEIVQVEVPDRVQVEVFDEKGDPYDPPVYVWIDDPNGGTHLVDVEQSLGDPYDLTLQAQGAPTWIAARESIPAGISPRSSDA